MPAGTKRKASFAFPYERPSKLSKRSSSTTVSKTLSKITKRASTMKPRLAVPRFPSLKATKITEVSASAPLPIVTDVTTPPALRRASTLTLEDEGKDVPKSRSVEPSVAKPTSMSRTSSSFVEEGALVTRLSGLKSGSIVGETALASTSTLMIEPSLTKSLTKKSSKAGVPSIPSGLTKLVLPDNASKKGSLHLTTSTLVTDVDETEMSSALDSLKSHLSKDRLSMTKSASTLSKSASIRSNKSSNSDDSDKADTVMETTEASISADPAVPGAPPGDGPMEVAISFDTTGSMYSTLDEVRAKVQDLVQRLQSDIPGIRVAIIAHGDYCDADTYVVKWIDFGASLPEICDFVNNVQRTGGGDGPECYELVLQRAREVMSWTPGSRRVLIMIGDDVPHEPGYTYGGKTYHINWRDECEELRKMNVKVYGVQAGYEADATKNFHEEMARITGGKRLTLRNFSSLFDILMMICYREGNPEMLAIYEQEIIDRGERMTEDIHNLKKTFDMTSSATTGTKGRGLLTHKPKAKEIRAMERTREVAVAKGKKTKAKTPKIKTKITPAVKTTVPKNKTKKTPTLAKQRKAKQTKQAATSKKAAIVQKREKLTDSCMCKGPLKSIVWSKWVRAVEPKMPSGKGKANYVKFSTNNGYGPKKIFDGNFNISAIYEIAVQVPNSQRKYVVYLWMSRRGFTRSGLWATNLLRHKLVRKEVDSVLSQGCTIFIRRGTPKVKNNKKQSEQIMKASDFIKDNYDFAWKKYIWRRSEGSHVGSAPSKFGLKHRQVRITRKGKSFFLSDNKL